MGYYDNDHSRSPQATRSCDASRDDDLSDTGVGDHPESMEWRSDGNSGLKNRLQKQVDTTLCSASYGKNRDSLKRSMKKRYCARW